MENKKESRFSSYLNIAFIVCCIAFIICSMVNFYYKACLGEEYRIKNQELSQQVIDLEQENVELEGKMNDLQRRYDSLYLEHSQCPK